MKKLLSALFVCLFLMGTMITNVNAQEPLDVSVFGTHECEDCNECLGSENSMIQPRVPTYVCKECASFNTTTTYVSTGSWKAKSTSACIHYDFGDDVLQQRNVTYRITCKSCGDSYTMDKIESRTICRGYN